MSCMDRNATDVSLSDIETNGDPLSEAQLYLALSASDYSDHGQTKDKKNGGSSHCTENKAHSHRSPNHSTRLGCPPLAVHSVRKTNETTVINTSQKCELGESEVNQKRIKLEATKKAIAKDDVECEVAVEAFQNEIDRSAASSGPPDKNNAKQIEFLPCKSASYPLLVRGCFDKRSKHNNLGNTSSEVINIVNQSTELVVENMYFSLGFDDCILGGDTLEEALKALELSGLLDDLDTDLEMVKREEKTKADHAKYFDDKVNKQFKKLSAKFHPDRVKNRGGSEVDLAKSTAMQQSMNSVWTILKMLHSNFISDEFLGEQNFKYATCSQVEINILNNEERLKNINNKILIELSWLSRIKHEEIIPYLNNFLVHVQSSLAYFDADEENFKAEREEALLHFQMCVSGYGKLVQALQSLMEECLEDKELAYIKNSTKKMLENTSQQLKALTILSKNPDFERIPYLKTTFCISERDFVVPFMEYLELLSMCHNIIKVGKHGILKTTFNSAKHYFCKGKNFILGAEDEDEDDNSVNKNIDNLRKTIPDDFAVNSNFLHYCVRYCCQNDSHCKQLASDSLERAGIRVTINKVLAKDLFYNLIKRRSKILKEKFRPLKISKLYSLGQCVKDINKLLEAFRFEYEEASKGIQEIREERKKADEEHKKRNTKLQEEMKRLEEREKRVREMLQKLSHSAMSQ